MLAANPLLAAVLGLLPSGASQSAAMKEQATATLANESPVGARVTYMTGSIRSARIERRRTS